MRDTPFCVLTVRIKIQQNLSNISSANGIWNKNATTSYVWKSEKEYEHYFIPATPLTYSILGNRMALLLSLG